MRIAFPVIFIRNGNEFAGLVCTSSPRKDQIVEAPPGQTIEQRFNELRCNIAFFDPTIRGWSVADNVQYLPIDQPIPDVGDFYSEVGAPDAGERLELRTAQAEHAAKMEEGRRAFEALPPEEQARRRAEFAAANGASSPTPPITGHAEELGRARDSQLEQLADEEIRSPDPVDMDAAAGRASSADTAAELAVDDALDAGEGR